MIQSQKLFFRIYVVIIVFTVYCFGDRVSHYEAAWDLFSTVKEKITSLYIDSIVEYIIVEEPEYKNERSQIRSLIQKFIMSKEFKELWLNALMYFFTENEIEEITIKLKNPDYNISSLHQTRLVKKYEDIFNKLKNKFIERFQLKLKKKIIGKKGE